MVGRLVRSGAWTGTDCPPHFPDNSRIIASNIGRAGGPPDCAIESSPSRYLQHYLSCVPRPPPGSRSIARLAAPLYTVISPPPPPAAGIMDKKKYNGNKVETVLWQWDSVETSRRRNLLARQTLQTIGWQPPSKSV